MSQKRYEGLIYSTRGSFEFRDLFLPAPSKNEWGVDTLLREMKGPPFLYEDFVDRLRQGTVYNFKSKAFYLQSWDEIADAIFPGVRLNYKGLTNGIPDPVVSFGTIFQSGSKSWEGEVTSGTYGDITSATLQYNYETTQTTHRYISNGRPVAAKYSAIYGPSPRVTNSSATMEATKVIETVIDSETVKNPVTRSIPISNGYFPAAIGTALALTPSLQVTISSAEPIIGTPYFECTDTVIMLLV